MISLLHSYFFQNPRGNHYNFDWEIGMIQIPLRIIGLWPNAEKKMNISFVISATLVAILLVPLTVQIFFYTDGTDIIFNILMWTIFTFINIQLWICKLKNQTIKLILTNMNNNWIRLRHLPLEHGYVARSYAVKSRHATSLIYCFVFVGTIGINFIDIAYK